MNPLIIFTVLGCGQNLVDYIWFFCQILIWSMLDILVQILVTLHFFERIAIIYNITNLLLQVLSVTTSFSKIFNMIIIHYIILCFKYDMLRLNLWISPSGSFTFPIHMDSYSKQCTNCCDISRTVFPRGEYSDNSNHSIFSFRMHRPIFLHGQWTLKISLLLLCSGVISSGFCFSFDHLWRISSEQTILDSIVHTLWLNITAGSVICLIFLIELPQ